MYFSGDKYVCRCPKQDIHAKQQVGIDVCRKQDVEECQHGGGQHDGDHGRALAHTDGKQFVVDMVLVGQEGILAVAHTVEIDSHHIEAWYQQGGERHDERIEVMGRGSD